MNKKVLMINAGSSSIKLQLLDKEKLNVVASGLAERITLEGNGIITIKHNDEKNVKNIPLPDHKIAVENILEMLETMKIIENPEEIEIIGFRVVHGGPFFTHTVKLTDKEINLIEKAKIYAPLHNPGAVQTMRAFQKVMPNAKMSVEFDTAFHTTIPNVNAIYPIPLRISEKYKIKKYGAHGISHEYIMLKVQELLNKKKVNVLSMHIGNGASLCAIKDNKSFDTSMGLTPLAGIMMGSRSGDIDPSIHEFLAEQTGMSIKEITMMLNKQSGMLGVSELSSDLRDIMSGIKKGNKKAEFAFELYCQKIVDYAANYANKLQKIDAIVFTAGVGENTPLLRERVIENLHFANIKIDKEINNKPFDDYVEISTKDSEIKVFVIRTNEELLIAKHAIDLYK